jgi:transcriptional regulator with XRE-family HTH domain
MPRRSYTTSFTLALGERIRSLRLELGISLSQLSEASGISKGHLSSIEHGFAAITTESLYRIAVALDVSPLFLWAFPEGDEYVMTVDLMRQIPVTHLKKMRKIMRKWIAEMELER